MPRNPRKDQKKVKPQKSLPKPEPKTKSDADQIADRKLTTMRKEFAEERTRIHTLHEFFEQTLKLAKEFWKLSRDFGYDPSKFENRGSCKDLKVAHEKLHEAAWFMRGAERTRYSRFQDTEQSLRSEEMAASVRKSVAKRLAKTA